MRDVPTLTTAQTEDEVCAAAARWWCWENKRKYSLRFGQAITWKQVLALTLPIKHEAMVEMQTLLEKVLGKGATWLVFQSGVRFVVPGPRLEDVRGSGSVVFRLHTLMEMHAEYLKLPEPRPPHPLTPLVAVLLMPRAGIDTRQHQNIHNALVRTPHVIPRHYDGQQMLLFNDTELMPALSPSAARFEVGWLPHLEPRASGLSQALLDLLEFGASRGYGGPVPVSPRLGWEMILMPEPGDFHNEQATVTPTHAELAARVWPASRYKRTKHGPQLYEAARWLNDPQNAIRWTRNEQTRPILLVTFFAPPFAPYHPDDRIGANVILPDGGRKRGAQFDAYLRRELAATSYRQHRVYMAAVCLWDIHATFGGHLTQLTVPEVKRNAAGYVLKADGEIAIERNGSPSRRPTHPHAVQTGRRVPTPTLDKAYPWLEGIDVILAAHHRVADTLRERNEQRRLTVETLDKLRIRPAGAVLDFEVRYRHDGVLTGTELAALPKEKAPRPAELEAIRLLPSRSHFAAYQARQEERRKARRRRRT